MNNLKELLLQIPPDIVKFLLVTLFSLLIGLEQRRRYIHAEFESLFGTDRTFTLIGILGYILYIISPLSLLPFLCGGAVVALLLAIFYFQKIKIHQRFGLTSLVTALITYCLAPLIYTQPAWLVLLIVVLVLVLTEAKATLFEFTQRFDNNEFITLAKFLVLAGIILPLLPDQPISTYLDVTPYRFWLAIVAVSGISYASYLLKKFVFPESGLLITGLLGGLYSSTATTIILARKSKAQPGLPGVLPAMLLATAMMYLRVLLLAWFFNPSLAGSLAAPFAVFTLLSVLLAVIFHRLHTPPHPSAPVPTTAVKSNPLEFKTALLFAALFLFFALITNWVKGHYGAGGIRGLSYLVGVTDIDPFILNLFQGHWKIADSVLVMAVVNAVTSNNLLKMLYAVALSEKSLRRPLVISFGILIITGFLLSFIFYF